MSICVSPDEDEYDAGHLTVWVTVGKDRLLVVGKYILDMHWWCACLMICITVVEITANIKFPYITSNYRNIFSLN